VSQKRREKGRKEELNSHETYSSDVSKSKEQVLKRKYRVSTRLPRLPNKRYQKIAVVVVRFTKEYEEQDDIGGGSREGEHQSSNVCWVI